MTKTAPAPQFMGVRIKRREDPALITGQGKYTGDIHLEGMVYMAVVRSPYAHARIKRINTSAAAAVPGVLGVFTGADLNPQLKRPLPMDTNLSEPEYSEQHEIPRYPLATNKVRHVGDPVAVVVAESRYLAADAAEAVQVAYEPLPVIVDPELALAADVPLLYEEWGTNLAFRWRKGNGKVDDAFAAAEKVVEVRIANQRLLPTAMEPRAVAAQYDAANDHLTIWTSTQIPHNVQRDVAAILGLGKAQVRVIAPEVGGGFGAKGNIYGEEVLVPLLARRFNHPVKWVATRSEDFVATSHGRDQIDIIRLAADKSGRVHAADLKVIADCGAYYSRAMPGIPPLTGKMMTGVYDIPNARCEALGVMTNKNINEPYRGAGRPEAAFLIERAMDVLADELGLDPVEVRRINFIPPDKFPYETPTGAIYDSGAYAMNLGRALELVDYSALRAEQTQRLQQAGGKLLGIGLACYVEICGFDPSEAGIVRVDQEGKATVLSGTSPHGQGHATAWTQIASAILQIPPEEITVIHGDTAVVPRGFGTYGSRSASLAGNAVANNAETVRERAKAIAAHLLEAAVADVTLTDGKFHVVGSPGVAVTWREVAQAAHSDGLPEDLRGELKSEADFKSQRETYPFGTHVAVVEIDPTTGAIEIRRYVTVDDCGHVINPLLVEGQVHGGIVQGVGQALFEHAYYDEIGNLLTGTLMDYTLPRADNFPPFETHRTATPSPLNPLGIKGIGEAATIGSTPTIVNAVVDALSHLGVRNLDMPLTAEKVWRAIHERNGQQ
jgi:aerobic carbon-monoxide dehydrogenase large subunit